jgi:DNA polymerase-4
MGVRAALGRRNATPELIRETLGYLNDRVASRCRPPAKGKPSRSDSDRPGAFLSHAFCDRVCHIVRAISTTLTLTEVAEGLAHSAVLHNEREREITLIAVSVSKLRPEHSLSSSYPSIPLLHGEMRERPGSVVEACRWGVDRSVDTIRDKFGRTAAGYAPVALSASERVPEEFRQLAERGPSGKGVNPKRAGPWHQL